MRKVVAVVVVLGCVVLAACAASRHPVRGQTMEVRPIAPTDVAQIQAAADEAHAAAVEQQERLQQRAAGR